MNFHLKMSYGKDSNPSCAFFGILGMENCSVRSSHFGYVGDVFVTFAVICFEKAKCRDDFLVGIFTNEGCPALHLAGKLLAGINGKKKCCSIMNLKPQWRKSGICVKESLNYMRCGQRNRGEVSAEAVV